MMQLRCDGHVLLPDVDSRVIGEMDSHFKTAMKGTAMVGIGIALKSCVALPLYLKGRDEFWEGFLVDTSSAAANGLVMLWTSFVVNLSGKGLIIGGATRCNIAASRAYDINSLGMKKNSSWGFYKTGCALEAAQIGVILGGIVLLFVKESLDLFITGILSGIVLGNLSDLMFTASAINASIYSGKSLSSVQQTEFNIRLIPTVSFVQKSAGLILNCSF